MCDNLKYYHDAGRHLVCIPYSVKNIHRMTDHLGIKRCWYHSGSKPHYDIPKRRFDEIATKSTLVDSKTILKIIKNVIDKNDLPV